MEGSSTRTSRAMAPCTLERSKPGRGSEYEKLQPAGELQCQLTSTMRIVWLQTLGRSLLESAFGVPLFLIAPASASNCCLILPPPSPLPVPPRTCHLVAQFLHLLTAGAHCREEALTLRLQLLPLSIIEGQVLRG